jgi:hypothetical protein
MDKITIDDALALRGALKDRGLHSAGERTVIVNILSGHYDRLKNAKEVALDDIKFLNEDN